MKKLGVVSSRALGMTTIGIKAALLLSLVGPPHSAFAQTIAKIPLTTAMASRITPTTEGNPALLVDEQTLSGVPVAGSKTPTPLTNWKAIYGGKVMKAKIDLGKEYVIRQIYLYDANGTGDVTNGPFYKVDSLHTATPTNLIKDPMKGYMQWRRFDVNVTTRALQVENPTGYFGMHEIVLMGYPAPTGTAPVVATLPNVTMTAGATQSVYVTATDVEGGTLTMTAVTLPAFATLVQTASGKATVTLKPTASHVGTHSITVQAKDTTGLYSRRTFSVTVNASTTSTVSLSMTSPTNALTYDPAKSFVIAVSVTDTSKVVAKVSYYAYLTTQAMGNPIGSDLVAPYTHTIGAGKFAAGTKVIAKAIATNSAGTKLAEAMATITMGTTSPSPTPGTAPALAAIANVSMAEATTKTIGLSATDVDGGHITLSTVGTRPAFAIFSQTASGVGSITLKPLAADVGSHSITVQAKDSSGLYSRRTFTVTVTGDIPLGKMTPHYKGSAAATGSAHGFYEYLPGDFATTTKTYPLIVFFHGAGKRGNGLQYGALDQYGQMEQPLGAVATEALPKLIKNGKQLNAIVLMPQRYLGTSPGWPESLTRPFVEFAMKRHASRIDPKRVYITGLSMGGGGSWLFAKNNPTVPAAILAVCGYDASPGYEVLRGVPIWATHHEVDGIVPYSSTLTKLKQITGVNPELTRPQDAPYKLASDGVTKIYLHHTAGWDGTKWNWRVGTARPPVNENPILTTFEGSSHNSWDKTYGNPAVYDWMLDQSN